MLPHHLFTSGMFDITPAAAAVRGCCPQLSSVSQPLCLLPREITIANPSHMSCSLHIPSWCNISSKVSIDSVVHVFDDINLEQENFHKLPREITIANPSHMSCSLVALSLVQLAKVSIDGVVHVCDEISF